MKKATYEKVGIFEQVEYANPRRWEPLEEDFRINAIGIHEMMPPVIVDRPAGTADWLFILFHDPATVIFPDGTHQIEQGTLVCWPHGAEHQYGRENVEWDHTWIHFDGSWVAGKLAECSIVCGTFLKLLQTASMETCLWQLYTELTSHQQPDQVILKNIFHNWLRELIRDAREGDSPFIPESICQVKQYLDQHTRQKITLQHLAEKAGMSVPNLCAQFRRCYGDSPINYLIGLRLKQARYLLLDRRLSVSEVAERIGYEDIYHFSKLFKKHFGASPRALRRLPL
ncbi:MAG: AraC family transcriptional regulator [Kiritimatiellales bacterium]